MKRGIIAIGWVAGLAASVALPAQAEPARVAAVTVSATPTPPTPALHGVAVVAGADSTDAAWPLAQALYADPSLRPAGLDEARARVLCGEAPAPDAPVDLRDLADTIAALRGEDAPSRVLLGVVARRLAVTAVVVVRAQTGAAATARVFLSDRQEFDAATYTRDAPPSTAWTAAARSLARVYGSPATSAVPPPAATAPAQAPALATQELSKTAESKKSHPFYLSPWFWSAVGVAALAGGGAYLLSRDTGSSTIHLQVQGP